MTGSSGLEQPGHDQAGRGQTQPVDVPHRRGEEPTRGMERDLPGHPRPGQHPDHRPPPGRATIPVASTVNTTNVPRRRNTGRNGIQQPGPRPRQDHPPEGSDTTPYRT